MQAREAFLLGISSLHSLPFIFKVQGTTLECHCIIGYRNYLRKEKWLNERNDNHPVKSYFWISKRVAFSIIENVSPPPPFFPKDSEALAWNLQQSHMETGIAYM